MKESRQDKLQAIFSGMNKSNVHRLYERAVALISKPPELDEDERALMEGIRMTRDALLMK